MKKSQKLPTIGGRVIVSLCVLWMISCAADYEDLHTIAVDDTIPVNDAESYSAANTAADSSSETNLITKSITFCESSGCYDGEFLSLYTDYAKSELTTDIIPIDQTDIVISCSFITDTSGDMVRLIAGFYNGRIMLSEKVYTGMTLTDRTTDVSLSADIPAECDGIVIAVQAKYESKKGGSRSDMIRFIGLQVTDAEQSKPHESDITDEPELPQTDIHVDETADLTEDTIIEETQSEVISCDETNDITNDTESEETFCETNKNDETDDVSSDGLVVLTNLRTDYSKCHVEMIDYIKLSSNEITVEMSFCSDSSGDMVRAVVECYDEDYTLLDSIALAGARSSAGEWVSNIRNVLLPDGSVYIKIYAEAKYETKKGGSKEDIIICKGQVVIHNS